MSNPVCNITHVHDPRHVEDVLDHDLPTIWRQEDEAAKAENRKFGAGKAARTRAGKGEPKASPHPKGKRGDVRADIAGWHEFEATGLLR